MPIALLRRVWNMPATFMEGRNESTKWFRRSRAQGYLHRGVFDGFGNKKPRTVFVLWRTGLFAAAIHQAGWQIINGNRRRVIVEAASK